MVKAVSIFSSLKFSEGFMKKILRRSPFYLAGNLE